MPLDWSERKLHPERSTNVIHRQRFFGASQTRAGHHLIVYDDRNLNSPEIDHD